MFLCHPLSSFYISLYNCVLPCFAYCSLMFSAFFQQLGGTTATFWILRAWQSWSSMRLEAADRKISAFPTRWIKTAGVLTSVHLSQWSKLQKWKDAIWHADHVGLFHWHRPRCPVQSPKFFLLRVAADLEHLKVQLTPVKFQCYHVLPVVKSTVKVKVLCSCSVSVSVRRCATLHRGGSPAVPWGWPGRWLARYLRNPSKSYEVTIRSVKRYLR